MKPATGTINNLRWWIGAALFASTVVNYIDRQTLSVLAPYLKQEFHWTNSDFALIVISFRAAYAIGQTLAGRALDRLGTRLGLALGVLWYSAAAMLTSMAGGLRSFAAFRFLLGLGEAGNWPGAAKAVAEWFPKSERGLAVAPFDSGSAVGGAVAPALVVWLYASFGSWRPVFVFTGLLGLFWVALWSWLYRKPEEHPKITARERAMILAAREEEHAAMMPAAGWSGLLRMRTTWGIILGKSLTDPVWFFVTDWFAIYLVSKGFAVADTLMGFWIPFLAADAGNFIAGWFSGWLVRRGWSAVRARKFVIVICGAGMALLAAAAFSSSLPVLVAVFAISTFCYAAWSTMGLALPADLYPSGSVASVSGLSGTGAGIGTIISTFLIGWSADRYSFQPVLIGASVIPLLATALVLLLVRERRTA